LGASACGQQGPPEGEGGAPVRVQVTAVRYGPIAERLDVPGETAARVSLRLTSPVAGRVTFLAALPGDRLAGGAGGARALPLANEAALHGFALLEGSGEAASATDPALRDRLRRHDLPPPTP